MNYRIEKAKEVVAKLDEQGDDAWEALEELLWENEPNQPCWDGDKEELCGMKFEMVDDFNYGDGHDHERIFRLGNQLFQATGWYSSWGDSGTNLREMFPVQAVSKLVTIYQPIEGWECKN